MNYLTIIFSLFLLISCATNVPNYNLMDQDFPSVKASRFNGQTVSVLDLSKGKKIVLVIGMVQRAQVDIDRWTTALTEKNESLSVVEIMVLNSWLPKVQAKNMSDKMGDVLQENMTKLVLPEYDESEKVRKALGTGNPDSAHVLFLNKERKVIFQHDTGFSTEALEKLLKLQKK